MPAGELAERSNAAVLKTASPEGLEGSNPSLSAMLIWWPRSSQFRVGQFFLIQRRQVMPASRTTPSSAMQDFIRGFHGVRYQTRDVERSLSFYTQQLGFKLDHKTLPAFAQVSMGALKLFLSGPGASGSRPMPDRRKQEPGGWNRVVLEVDDLPARIDSMKKAGLHFRNQMEEGPAGKQIQVEDPDGNPIELFEPAR
jgi:glyoxylase I family protein